MNLKNPESEYRPIPFWSWNDKLEINELTRQIKEMKTAGMGGFFMHARGGLQTKYLSQEWFDAVEACVKQAKELDMQPWLYDENGWPSGSGDGRVNNSGAEYQQKYLRLEKVETTKVQKTATTIAFFSLDGHLVTDPLASTEPHVLHCFYELNPYYVDLLDHKMVKIFLQEVYEKYAKQLSKKSWKNTIGFFTDEPQLSRKGIPWSLVLPVEYSSEYNDDLIKNIPALFMELPDYRKIRVRFWSMITKLFMNSFMKQVRDWCDKNDCMLTGHHVLEESYLSQLTTNGAVMPQYCYYNIPGMDWLSNERTSLITMIQLSSAAAQMGAKKVLSETFAMCGWNISFSEMRHLYQYQMVHGINLLCQHLQSYSLRGKRKHDYPPSLFVHQPWWNKYHLFNDYVARIGMLLTEGKWNCKVLILHGQSSAWMQFNARDNGFIESYSNSLEQLSQLLDTAHVNYHYGDETIIEREGSASAKVFTIGRQNYSTVILPQVSNISRTVKHLLEKYMNAGGIVLAVKNKIEQTPLTTDGETDSSIGKLTKNFIWFESEKELIENINNYTEYCSITGAETGENLPDIIFTSRYFENLNEKKGTLYYFINSCNDKQISGRIKLPGNSARIINAETGEFEPVSLKSGGSNSIEVVYNFVESGALLIFVSDEPYSYAPKSHATRTASCPTKELDGDFDISLKSENALTIDRGSFFIDDKLIMKYEDVSVINNYLLRLKEPVKLKLEFSFDISRDFDLSTRIFLIIENPEVYKVCINNAEISNEPCGFYLDSAFSRLELKNLCVHGKNTVTLQTVFRQSEETYAHIQRARKFETEGNKLTFDMEINPVYITGNFAVKSQNAFVKMDNNILRFGDHFYIDRLSETCNNRALTETGLMFFAGTAGLRKKFFLTSDEIAGRILKMDKLMACHATVRINGKFAGELYWHPLELDLSGFLNPGENTIEIELVNSLRNLLGPHHLEEGESHQITPGSFLKEENVIGWAPSSYNHEYSFVQLGFSGLRLC
jgi:hypothetical protein